MPTAYTSLLGLALPVTGELQGTWGQTVNDAITSLLDTAVAGTTTLNTDADVTLTTTTGASNQARQAIILWTANGTTTRNITAPAQSKAYVVINASAGTQSIVIRGVGPTTGVTVAKGEKVLVAWNGSDFVRVAAYGGTGEFTTVDTTNLEVTNVKAKDGTAAATIADSTGVVTITANPILNGGTANGVLYLNGSKVATSGSALTFDGTNAATTGTMSATKFIPTGGTATGNGLYLPAANTLALSTNGTERVRVDSSGNVGIGTNSPTYAVEIARGAGLQAGVSIRANGNAVASEFLLLQSSDGVTAYAYNRAAGSLIFGTNNTDRMVVNAVGNVGIGTTAPTAYSNYKTLALAGGSNGFVVDAFTSGGITAGGTQITSRADSTVLSAFGPLAGTAAFFAINTGTYGASFERMRVDGSGNLGLGVTPSAWSSAAGIDFPGNASVGNWQLSSNGLFLGSNFYYASGSYKYKSTATVAMYAVGSGAHIWYSAPSGTADTNITLTERMRIDTSGNLGLGVVPSIWSTSGNIEAPNSANFSTQGTTVGINTNAYFNVNWKYAGTGAATRYAQVAGTHQWYNATSGIAGNTITFTEQMRLDASGNLGVNTNFPLNKLHVVSTPSEIARFESSSQPYISLYEGSTRQAYLWAATGAAYLVVETNKPLIFSTNNTERMRITSTGNVGIGNASPTVKLHLEGGLDATFNANMLIKSTAATVKLAFDPQGGTSSGIGAGADYLAFYNYGANTERMRIDSSGNLGLGVTPSAWVNYKAFQIGQTGSFYSDGGGVDTGYGSNFYWNGSNWVRIVTGSASRYHTALGAHYWYTAASGTAGTNITFSEQMRLDSSGNLGLGTTSPGGSANDRQLTLSGSTSSQITVIGATAASGNFGASSTSAFVGTGSNHPFLLIINNTERMRIDTSGNVLVTGVGGLGYGTGSGGAVTQATSRTTGVTLDKTNGAITLVSAAGTTTWQSFTVTNNKVAATDTVIVNQKSGTDLYEIHVTAVAAGSFRISFKTTGGTTTEQPVFNFALIKAVTA